MTAQENQELARLDRKIEEIDEKVNSLVASEARADERRKALEEKYDRLEGKFDTHAKDTREAMARLEERLGRRWGAPEFVAVGTRFSAFFTGLGGLVYALMGHPPPAMAVPPTPVAVEAPAPEETP